MQMTIDRLKTYIQGQEKQKGVEEEYEQLQRICEEISTEKMNIEQHYIKQIKVSR